MKNIFKKLVIVTSFALISCTGLHAQDDLTFATVVQKATENKNELNQAIEAISRASITSEVLKENQNELTDDYKLIFENNIKTQEDDNIKNTLATLYVAKIAGAAVYRVTAAVFENVNSLSTNKDELQTKVNDILESESIGYKNNKYKDINIAPNAINIANMLEEPMQMLTQVNTLITSLQDAKNEITAQYKAVTFEDMLNAKFNDQTMQAHLDAAANNIGKLDNEYFTNIKSALVTRGESISVTKDALNNGIKITTKKDGISNLLQSVFKENKPLQQINQEEENQ